MGLFSKLFGGKSDGVRSDAIPVDPKRYEGRPLIVILENYVLDCIGALELDKQDSIRQLVQKVFNGGDDWKQAVRQQLELPERFDDDIREMWQGALDLAWENDAIYDPRQFAIQFVDDNFGDEIEPVRSA